MSRYVLMKCSPWRLPRVNGRYNVRFSYDMPEGVRTIESKYCEVGTLPTQTSSIAT